MKKSFKYIFGILLTSALLVTGCGSSSSNNPVGNGSVNSGLVSVSGSVKNSNGDGTVSFYSPSAIYSNNMNSDSSFRAAVNNEVYTFNIDENGNYAGQVPAGDYYIIAQNSDGSLKYASSRMAVQSEAVAEGDTDKVDFDITLVPTISISGTLHTASELVKDQYVYIENMPFVAITDSTGNFTLTSVPATDTYTICSNIWQGNTRYHFSSIATKSQISDKKITGITISNPEPISLTGKNVKVKVDEVGIKRQFSDKDFDSVEIIAITSNNEIYTASKVTNSQEEGKMIFALPIDKKSEVTNIIINLDDVYRIFSSEDLEKTLSGIIEIVE